MKHYYRPKPNKKLSAPFLIGCLLFAMASSATAGWSKQAVKDMVIREAERQQFSAPLALAVAEVESNFDPYARSHVDARGVMQIMPRTAELDLGVSAASLYNPRVNIRAGVKFLKHLISVYDGRVDIALSHYNGGSRVRKPNGSLRVLPATRKYVDKVLARASRYQAQQKTLLAVPHRLHASDKAMPFVSDNSRVKVLDDFSNGDPLVAVKRQFLFSPEAQKIKASTRRRLAIKLQQLANYNRDRVLGNKRVGSAHSDQNKDAMRRELVRQWERR